MVAELVADVLIAYGAVGLAFACAFVTAGAGRLDEAAARSGWRFRAMVLPGAAALWPFLLYRWLRVAGGDR